MYSISSGKRSARLIPLLIILFVVTIISFLIWWLVFESEGVYLGRRVVIWLYDRYAGRYDSIKQFDEVHEHLLLSKPILAQTEPNTDPLILDIATGTGRLPIAMCQHITFVGHVIGLDLSRNMLKKASKKLRMHHFDEDVTLIWDNAETLPFRDDTFDVVTCLEALEFMPNRLVVLGELCRVLRPSGTLLITNRINTRWMPNRLWLKAELYDLLESMGMTDIRFEPWQIDYTKVWCTKQGPSDYLGKRPLDELIRCPNCVGTRMTYIDNAWHCDACAGIAHVAEDGVIELYPLRNSHSG